MGAPSAKNLESNKDTFLALATHGRLTCALFIENHENYKGDALQNKKRSEKGTLFIWQRTHGHVVQLNFSPLNTKTKKESISFLKYSL